MRFIDASLIPDNRIDLAELDRPPQTVQTLRQKNATHAEQSALHCHGQNSIGIQFLDSFIEMIKPYGSIAVDRIVERRFIWELPHQI
jgi:hypothetical protein